MVKPPNQTIEHWRRFSCEEYCNPHSPYFDVEVLFDSLEWEDGSGNNWNFRGKLPPPHADIFVRGFYSTANPNGWIVFETAKERKRGQCIDSAVMVAGLMISQGDESYPNLLKDVLAKFGLSMQDYDEMRQAGLL